IADSGDAKELAENVQAQVNALVVQGDSSVEARQARVDAKGVEAATLKARLDAEQNAVTAQLADNAQNMLQEFLVRSKPQYGRLVLPEWFIKLDFELYRHGNGLISHSIALAKYKKGQELYVANNGSNSSGDGSVGNP